MRLKAEWRSWSGGYPNKHYNTGVAQSLDAATERRQMASMQQEPSYLIRSRRAVVAARLTELDVERDVLRHELGELDVATRVLGRLSGDTPPAPAEEVNGGKGLTIPDMIENALAIGGPAGLMPQDVLTFIQEHYRRDADPNHVRPALWRLWKAGRVARSADRYFHLEYAPTCANENGEPSGNAASPPDAGGVAPPPFDDPDDL